VTLLLLLVSPCRCCATTTARRTGRRPRSRWRASRWPSATTRSTR